MQKLHKIWRLVTIAALLAGALNLSMVPVTPVQAASFIAQWNFESPNPADVTDTATYPNTIAPAIGTGNAGGVHASAVTDWSTPTGNGSADSFSSNTWAIGDYYQFRTSTSGYNGIQVTWDQTGSNTGPRDFKLAYSADGTTFYDFAPYSITNDSWSSGTYNPASTRSQDLSSITAINNQANVYFRLIVTSTTAINGTTVAAGGAGRVDNFTVSGTAIPTAPTVNLSVSTSSASEAAATVVTVTATASSAVTGDQTVNLAVTGTGITAGDYTLSNTTITIPDGSTTGSVTFTVVDDADMEGAETATLTISAPSAGIALGATTTQNVAITDDDAPVLPTVDLSVSTNSASETAATVVTVTATASPAVTGDQTVNLAVTGAGITAGDYNLSNTTITIPDGSTTGSVTFTVVDDADIEVAETATLTISAPSAGIALGATTTQNVAITDNDTPVLPTVNLSVSTSSASEAAATVVTVTATASPAVTGDQTVSLAVTGAGITAGDYTLSNTTITIPDGSTTGSVTFTVVDDASVESTETATLTISAPSAGIALGATTTQNITITDDDFVITPIHDIQGSGSSAVISTFTVDAIVVGRYQAQTSGQLMGFFLQEQDADADANPATSEGIFVYCLTCPTAVSVGDRVLVTGASSEYFNMSQLNATTAGSVVVLSSGNPLPTPASLTLPIPGVPTGNLTAAETFINAYYEKYEGMLVKVPATLSVSEYFELARYGQVILSAGGRPHTFTAVNTPTALGYTNHQIDLAARTIILDDPDNRQNRPSDVPNTAYFYPVPGLSTSNYFRGGDTIINLTGVLHWSFAGQTGTDAWRIRPVTEKYSYAFTPVNPRPVVPTVDGSLKVASFNVLNYFLTIDTSNVCAPTQNQDCRGADSAQELTRQRTKMLAALTAIDADVFGFMEMENTTGVEPLADIVAGLPGYDYIDTGVVGGDAIRVGIIYKTSTVTPVGAFKLLTSTVDPRFDDTKNRPALAQTFEEIATGETFTVVVNHLKSKGSSCGTGDDDTTTGQGNCNLTRTEAAEALADWLDTDPTGSGDPDFLIIGDLNSYAMEDPIVALETAGFTNLVESFGGADAYGYVFDGQLGYLDHALANTDLLPQVADLAEWHINADENPLFDYNDDVRTADEAAFDEESDTFPLYAPNEFRTSDHDPIIIGLNLDGTAPTITSIARAGTNPTNATSVNFTVTFSEAVSGVDTGDFEVNMGGTVSGASVTTVTPVSVSVYTVTVNTGSGDGTVRLDAKTAAAIEDTAGNPFVGPYTSGEFYSIDKTAPTITSIARAGTNPTKAASVPFTVTFSEAVTGVDSTDFSLNISSGSISGATIGAISGSGTTWTVNVNTGSGDGVLRLDVKASADMDDLAGNNVSNLPFESGEAYTLDKTVPTVTMSSVVSDPVHSTSPISVTVQFSETVSGFTIDDITAVNGSVSNFVVGDGDTYTFDLTPTAPGLVTANILQDKATDLAGNGNTAAAQFQRTYSLYTLFLPLIKR